MSSWCSSFITRFVVLSFISLAPSPSSIRFNIEPPVFGNQAKLYAAYKKDLRMWSEITNIERKLQAEVVVYSLDGHSLGIKEKI